MKPECWTFALFMLDCSLDSDIAAGLPCRAFTSFEAMRKGANLNVFFME
jgi:hypothetical protein